MAGHFATLLRNTVETLLPDHDVYLTDWNNARDVPREAGTFGLDEYIAHMILFLETLGPGAHAMAVCQPCAALLAAVAVMAEADNPAQPPSMTLMAGPIDTRINPTPVNELATAHPIEWFEHNLITTVPARFRRRASPRLSGLPATCRLHVDEHAAPHARAYGSVRPYRYGRGREGRCRRGNSMTNISRCSTCRRNSIWRPWRACSRSSICRAASCNIQGRLVDPRAIRKTALLTVEGERDDICSVGQTVAAQDLCSSIKPFRRRHHMQAGVGHYGVFSGRRWETQIYPIVKSFIQANH